MSDVLYATNGEAFLRITNGNGAWKSKVTLPQSGAECLVVSPLDPETIFVGCRGNGVQRSTDGGETFEKLDFPAPDVFSVAVSPADGAVYAGCEPSQLFRSRDNGETWEELESLRKIPSASTWSFPPRPWTHHVRWIAPSPQDSSLLLVGIELGGIMRSTDDGETWADHRAPAVKDCHSLAWHPTAPGRAYESGGGGSAWTFDGGETWQRVDDGRDGTYRHYLTGLAVDPKDPDRWYVTASPSPMQAHGPQHANAAIYRWEGEGPWQQVEGGLPESFESFPYALAITAEEVFAGLEDGNIWAGFDRGERWQQLEIAGDPVRRIRALGCSPS
jgi:BNR/Asp-box repeat